MSARGLGVKALAPLLCALAFVCLPPARAEVWPQFTDVTAAAGIAFRHYNGERGRYYFPETLGAGCAWLDVDRDGWLDLFLVNGLDFAKPREAAPRHALYRNRGDGTFADISRQAGIDVPAFGVGCVVADYDNDGDTDIFVAAVGPNQLFRNNSDGTFSEVAAEAGVADPRWGSSAAFVDVDHDGWLDLYVANYVQWSTAAELECTRMTPDGPVRVYCSPDAYAGERDILYRNERNGFFSDHTDAAGIGVAAEKGLGVVCGDYDDDGDIDIYVANDQTPNLLWNNNGRGVFTDSALYAGVAYDANGMPQSGMGVATGDYNRDMVPDLVVTNFQQESATLYMGIDAGLFENVTFASGVGIPTAQRLAWGVHFLDADNDGWEDLFIACGHVDENIALFSPGVEWAQADLLLRNLGNGRFADVSAESGDYFKQRYPSRGSAAGDYDNDGDLDLAISMNNGNAVLLRNDGGNWNHWLGVSLEGTTSNRDGVGAKVMVQVGGKTYLAERRAGDSYASSSDPRVFFGLGEHEAFASLTVVWPDGGRDRLPGLPANQVIHVRQLNRDHLAR